MKKLSVLLLALLCFGLSRAQTYKEISGHEIGLHLGGGVSTLYKTGIGGIAGGDYTYFVNSNLGIGSGFEISMYNSKINAQGQTAAILWLIDDDNDHYDLYTFLQDYSETQRAYYLTLPLFLQYQAGTRHKIYARVGAKVGIPLSATYTTTDAIINNTGYYPVYDIWTDVPAFMGFGEFKKSAHKNPLDLRVAVSLSAEGGAKWWMAKGTSLYTGVYFEHALNDIRKENNVPLLRLSNNPQNFSVNSLLLAQSVDGSRFASKVSPWGFGVVLRLTFDVNGKTEEGKKDANDKSVDPTSIAATPEWAAKKDGAFVSQGEAKDKEIFNEMISGYAANRYIFNRLQRNTIDKQIAILKYYPKLSITCTAYTCDSQDKKFNYSMGMKRVKAIQEYMVSQGIDKKRITIKAVGNPARFLVPNNSEKNRAKNRRVEFKVQEK